MAQSESTDNTLAIGKYCWRAEYSGDSFYLPSSHTNATTECFTTVKQPSDDGHDGDADRWQRGAGHVRV